MILLSTNSTIEEILAYQKRWEDINKSTWLSHRWARQLLDKQLIIKIKDGIDIGCYKLTPAGRLLAESIA